MENPLGTPQQKDCRLHNGARYGRSRCRLHIGSLCVDSTIASARGDPAVDSTIEPDVETPL
eukprot:11214227-Lingulodinium_polyedra.AAC.1